MKFLLPFLTAFSVTLPAVPQDDIVLKAMHDEIERASKSLHLENYKSPYFVSYRVKQNELYAVSASFGAINNRSSSIKRTLNVDVRQGDYDLDSSNAGSGGMSMFSVLGSGGTALTTDDNYDALRHEMWLRTDAAYKKAVEDLAAKKAFLKDNLTKDMPASLSREDAVVSLDPPVHLNVEKGKIDETVRKLSAVFRNYPQIEKSFVGFREEADTRWLLNTDGFLSRGGKGECEIMVMAAARAADKTLVSDSEVFCVEKSGELPAQLDMEKRVESLAKRVVAASRAVKLEQYMGPVLFEDEGAAAFFAGTLQNNLGHGAESIDRHNPLSMINKNPLADKLGSRILPNFISVYDDPLSKKFGKTKILSSYLVDDEGVKAQKITLVDKGTLKTFAMSRVPSRDIKQSNGHARGSAGVVANLYVVSEKKLPDNKLRARLIELGKEEGLKEVIVVRKMSNLMTGLVEAESILSSVISMFTGGGEITLSSPCEIYKINTATGKEEVLRGAQFGNLTLRILRDIDCTGSTAKAYPMVLGGNIKQLMATGDLSTIVTPNVIVKEVEFRKPTEQTGLPPILKNPYFEEAIKAEVYDEKK